MSDRTASGTGRRTDAGGDFAGYLGRNLAGAYRFTCMVLGDPVAAQDVVHDALMTVWQAAGRWPPSALDEAFGRRLVGDCRKALRVAVGGFAPAGPDAELEAAVFDLGSDAQMILVEQFGPPGAMARVAATLQGRGTLERRAAEILEELRERPGLIEVPDGPPEALELRLRSLFAGRDPGDDAPFELRWRLQRSVLEAEKAAAQQAEVAAESGWGFAFKTIIALLGLTVLIAVASVVSLRNGEAAAASSGPGPASPLAITLVTSINGAVEGEAVRVAASQDTLVAAFAPSAVWHVSARQCLADVVGTIDAGGAVEWLGERAGHVDTIAGDPSSGSLYASGPGVYCDPGRFASVDGGRTWSNGPLPPGTSTSPDWLAFDPTRRATLLAASGTSLFISADGGSTWKSRPIDAVPIGFDAGGRLVAWRAGVLVESRDEGATWLQVGPGPAEQPIAGAATPGGVLLGLSDGLWWYPADGPPVVVHDGRTFSVATLGEGAVVLGADSQGRPWLGTVTAGLFRRATLPPELASLSVTGGEVAVNANGAVIALSGRTSAIALASFAR